MKIIFFTNKHPGGIEILKAMKTAKIPIFAIVIEKYVDRSSKLDFKKIMGLSFRKLFFILLQKLKQLFIPKNHEPWERDEYYRIFSSSIIIVDNFNSTKCENIIKELAPDIIILGGTRIIRENIIKIPKIGILNVHPGLLPKYRGVDVIPWSILNGDEIGVTVHFVDKGVDTGRICAQTKLPLIKNDSIKTIRKRAPILQAEIMVQVLQKLIKDGKIQTYPNPKEEGTQFYEMDYKTLHRAEQRLKERLKNEGLHA